MLGTKLAFLPWQLRGKVGFQLNSRNITLVRSFLHGECEDTAGRWHRSSLGLNRHIGNRDGSFTLWGSDWNLTARKVQLSGSKLNAELHKINQGWIESAVDLNLCVTNKNGELKFHNPWYVTLVPHFFEGFQSNLQVHNSRLSVSLTIKLLAKKDDHLLKLATCISLTGPRRPTLKALCLGPDGLLHVDEIDLDDHYSNRNGNLEPGDHFSYSCRDWYLELAPPEPTLWQNALETTGILGTFSMKARSI